MPHACWTPRVRSRACWLSTPDAIVARLPSRVHRTSYCVSGERLRQRIGHLRYADSATLPSLRSGRTRTRSAGCTAPVLAEKRTQGSGVFSRHPLSILTVLYPLPLNGGSRISRRRESSLPAHSSSA
eukprot:6511582-Pyramimonas_sp.AAC.2